MSSSSSRASANLTPFSPSEAIPPAGERKRKYKSDRVTGHRQSASPQTRTGFVIPFWTGRWLTVAGLNSGTPARGFASDFHSFRRKRLTSFPGFRSEMMSTLTKRNCLAASSEITLNRWLLHHDWPIQRTLTYFVRGSITHCMADLLFDWFGFNQASKYVTNSA